MISWYPVHTKPQAESTADRHLRAQGFETFYPFERVKQRRKLPNRNQFAHTTVERPYFPRYLFVGIHENTPPLALVNSTTGVSTLVYFGEGPLEIPHTVMGEMMAKTDEGGFVGARDMVARRRFKIGEMVGFKENTPLSGLFAEIALDDGKQIRVWLDMLGARRQVRLSPSEIGDIALQRPVDRQRNLRLADT